MPFKSLAQKRKFEELLKAGKISQSMFDEWNLASEGLKLPERVESSKSDKKVEKPLKHPLVP